MPLDTSQHFESRKSAFSVAELRLALIGHSDLKRSLLRDALFAPWLRDAFALETAKLLGDHVRGHVVLDDVHPVVVVLRLVVEQVLEASKPAPVSGLYVSLGGCVSCLFRILDYVQEHDLHSASVRLLGDIFDILLALGNTLSLFHAYMDFDKLWSFLCSLSLSTSDRSLVTCALKLVPFLLEQMAEASASHIESSAKLVSNLLSEIEVLFAEADLSEAKGLRQNMVFLQSMMVAVAQLLNYVKVDDPEKSNASLQAFFERPLTNKCMMSLLYTEDAHVLNLAALNLYQLHLLSSLEIENEEGATHELFQKLYPRIIELLQQDTLDIPKYLNFAISVLLDLCLKYSGVCVHLRNTNTDLKIMRDLLRLFEGSQVFMRIHQIKLSLKEGKHVADFTSLRSKEGSPPWFKDLDVIANFLLLLSVYTSANEDFRRRITSFTVSKAQKNVPNFICVMIFDITETYRFLINQILLNYEIVKQTKHQDFKWVASNISVLITLLEHPLFTNSFYLMRSLSRSVSTLRTFFVDCNSIRGTFDIDEEEEDFLPSRNIVETVASRYDREVSFDRRGNLIFGMLDILSKLEVASHIMVYFTSSGDRSRQHTTRKDFYVKRVIALASVANFILDFSSFRYEIVKRAEFLSDLASMFQKSVQTKARCDVENLGREGREIAFEQLRIQLAVLQVVKNYLYNENEENREVIWGYIPLALIFEKSLYGVATPVEEYKELHVQHLQHKVICFEILRNLTAASTHFSESISGAYESFVAQQTLRLDFASHIPESWDQYLVKNLMAYDLFSKTGEEKFFQDDRFALSMIKNPEYVKLVVAINYIEDHRYTNIVDFSGQDFPSVALLNIWKRLLALRILAQDEAALCSTVLEQVHLSNHLSEIKLSISWILINLTWKDGEFDFQSEKSGFSLVDTILPNASGATMLNVLIDTDQQDVMTDDALGPETRAKLLYKHGFSEVLQSLVQDMSKPRVNSERKMERFDQLNSNDVFEKAKAAHFQIISLVAKNDDAPAFTHPLRRTSNIINIREGRDIRHTLRNTVTSVGEENDSDEDESEEIDEYWIR